MSELYTTYILYSEKHEKIYVGQTSHLISRYYSHNKLAKKGYTIRYRPWKVIFVEHFRTREEAVAKEKLLKSGQGRAWIWNRIQAQYLDYGYIFK